MMEQQQSWPKTFGSAPSRRRALGAAAAQNYAIAYFHAACSKNPLADVCTSDAECDSTRRLHNCVFIYEALHSWEIVALETLHENIQRSVLI